MKPPKDAKVIETPTSIMWFEEDGLLCSISKPIAPNLQQTIEAVKLLKELANGEKLYILSDIENARPPEKEVRDYAANVLPDLVKAIAMTGSKPLARIVVNLFFGLKPPSYPTKLFTREEEARNWLRHQMHRS